ncbi:MAG: DUF1232 domain-containing protein [Anaerolineaceae bacterium]|jgi:uncharacterized membrane protein YkvA (DUF1232 family)|nr:DUF1232 domain-containing protein [Anaerolineaceae bacterium]
MTEEHQKSEDAKNGRSLLTHPLSAYSIPSWVAYLLGLIGLLYILNPTAGVLELIPDNLPFIGNLDEGVAAVLIWAAIMELVEGGKFKTKKGVDDDATE